MKLSLPPKFVEKLVWLPVISFWKIFIPSYAFDALLCQNWPFSPPNRETSWITLNETDPNEPLKKKDILNPPVLLYVWNLNMRWTWSSIWFQLGREGGEKKPMIQRRKKLIKILSLLTQLFVLGGLHFVSVLKFGLFPKDISLINVKLSTRFLPIESTSQISKK
jgi:hypothetical protein